MKTYTTLKDAAAAAFEKLKPTNRLYDGVDYWTLEDLLIKADVRQTSDVYKVDARGNIFIPGIEAPVYAVATQADAEWKTHIAYLRHYAGYTQQALANAASMNIRHIQKLESGEIDISKVSLKNALALSAALGVEPKDLL